MTRLLVVDDHPVFRGGIVSLFEATGYEIVGEAASVAEAIELADRTSPDVVIMDLGLPDGSGVDATSRIVAMLPTVRILVVTLFDDEGAVRAALSAGAAGYVVKDASPSEILAAVRAIEQGSIVLGSRIAASVSTVAIAPPPPPDEFGLTRRERDVLELIVRGLPNRQIADRLGLSGKTISNNVSTILAKTGTHDRVELASLVRSKKVT